MDSDCHRAHRYHVAKEVPPPPRDARTHRETLEGPRNNRVIHDEITQTADGGVLGRRLTASANLKDGVVPSAVHVGAEGLPGSSARRSVFRAQ